MGTMTKFVKNSEIKSYWYEIDAKNAVVGRLATIISIIIRGKNKNTYTPHMDHGDFVVVKNIEQIKFTGKKYHACFNPFLGFCRTAGQNHGATPRGVKQAMAV